jgi:hypothetical protein
MNDILPKPFTKEGLLEMLEVMSIPPLIREFANPAIATETPHAP